MIEVESGGLFTSIQDQGRPGFERFGIPPGGAADWFSAAVANRLLGNHPDAAVLECTATGPRLRFECDATIAMTGADGHAGDGWIARPVRRGEVIAVGPLSPGLRSYFAVRGGLDVPLVLGSRSLCQRGSFGGGYGRPLRAGDRLAIGAQTLTRAEGNGWPSSHRLPASGPWEVRVIRGPHDDAFGPDALGRLGATACLVTRDIDRMGLRVDTPALRLQPREIVTTPVPAGSIQVTPSGQLIVLLADHPTTGGYPVIATVVTADLPLLAQARPGDTIHFRETDLAGARLALRRITDWLD